MTTYTPQSTDMTNTQSTKQTPSNQQTIPDPRPGYTTATTLASTALSHIGAHNLAKPTPCDDYNVGQLGAHLVAVQLRVAAVARGEDPFTVFQEIAGLEPDGFVEAWVDATEGQLAAWADSSVLGRPLVLPFATLPGAIALWIYIGEVLVHTWDLATALGLELDWDQELAEAALDSMKMGLPAEPRGDEVPFASVVPTNDDAPAIDRLAAWLGRTPKTAV